MSTYILMKVLESTPCRYDLGIRILTFGRLDDAYDRLTSWIKKGQRVLDIGCGTGALTLRAAQAGAVVKGIDINPGMLEIAKKRAGESGLAQNIEFCEIGVAELGKEEPESYDAVMSGLLFSELSRDELIFTLREVKRILKPGGLLLAADEVISKNILKRVFNYITRLPLLVITYIITQTTTHAVRNLLGGIEGVNLSIESARLNWMGNFIELVAKKPVKTK